MPTKVVTSIHLTLALLIGLLVTEPAVAKWKVTAVWYITVYPSNSSVKASYTAYGSTKEDALKNARTTCEDSQRLEQTKDQCTFNGPNETFYIEVGEAPPGTYKDSCSTCRVEANLLVCDKCKPDSGQTKLDMSKCTAEEQSILENCHGRLVCGVCPEDTKKHIPNPPQKSCTKSGYCCTETGGYKHCSIPNFVKDKWKIETK
jgi:hypothetical protein